APSSRRYSRLPPRRGRSGARALRGQARSGCPWSAPSVARVGRGGSRYCRGMMSKRLASLCFTLPLFVLLGCSGGEPAGSGSSSGSSSGSGSGSGGGGGDTALEIPIPADPQRPGDPAKGYSALVNEGYVSCGIPNTAYAKVFGPAPPELQLPGRKPESATL